MKPSTFFTHVQRTVKYRTQKFLTSKNLNLIVERHFDSWATVEHVNKGLFHVLIKELGGKPARILETGTSAWGTDSTRFWDTYVSKFGGKVISVDIRPEAGILLRCQLSRKTQLITSDSVAYLASARVAGTNLYYFDSADVDWQDPEFSIQHGLNELLAVIDFLRPGQIVVFDDTPKNQDFVDESLKPLLISFKEKNGFFPGKGSKAIEVLSQRFKIKVLHHEYAFAAKILER